MQFSVRQFFILWWTESKSGLCFASVASVMKALCTVQYPLPRYVRRPFAKTVPNHCARPCVQRARSFGRSRHILATYSPHPNQKLTLVHSIQGEHAKLGNRAFDPLHLAQRMSTTSSAAASGTCPSKKSLAARVRAVTRCRPPRAQELVEESSGIQRAPDNESGFGSTSTFGVARGDRSRQLASQKTVNNLISFSQAGPLDLEFADKEAARAEYLRAHAKVKSQIHRMGRTTISPQSKFLGRWDVATATAMLWTAFVTPFQIAFLEPIEAPSSTLSILNRAVDAIFVTDMVLTFFIPYRESPHRGGMWTFDNKKIAKQCKLLAGPQTACLSCCLHLPWANVSSPGCSRQTLLRGFPWTFSRACPST